MLTTGKFNPPRLRPIAMQPQRILDMIAWLKRNRLRKTRDASLRLCSKRGANRESGSFQFTWIVNAPRNSVLIRNKTPNCAAKLLQNLN